MLDEYSYVGRGSSYNYRPWLLVPRPTELDISYCRSYEKESLPHTPNPGSQTANKNGTADGSKTSWPVLSKQQCNIMLAYVLMQLPAMLDITSEILSVLVGLVIFVSALSLLP
jgi:hypothetical protein